MAAAGARMKIASLPPRAPLPPAQHPPPPYQKMNRHRAKVLPFLKIFTVKMAEMSEMPFLPLWPWQPEQLFDDGRSSPTAAAAPLCIYLFIYSAHGAQ